MSDEELMRRIDNALRESERVLAIISEIKKEKESEKDSN